MDGYGTCRGQRGRLPDSARDLLQDISRHCTAAGVPAIRLHDTGHTAATRMLDSGTTVSATAKWLGHDPAMTLRVYGHVYDDAPASAGDVLLGGMPQTQEG